MGRENAVSSGTGGTSLSDWMCPLLPCRGSGDSRQINTVTATATRRVIRTTESHRRGSRVWPYYCEPGRHKAGCCIARNYLTVTFWVLTACHRPSRFTKKSVLRIGLGESAPLYFPFMIAVIVKTATSPKT